MSYAEPFKRFSLNDHVHACLADEHLVFMDLRADRYCCLEQADTEALVPLLRGSMPATRVSSRTTELLRQLVDSRLLTTSADGRSLSPLDVRTPEHELKASLPSGFPASRLPTFLLAATTTAIRLRARRLDRTIEQLKARRARREHDPDRRNQVRMAQALGAFRALRPIYPKPYVCLFDSLALLEYLAYDGLFPTLIFAVKLHPWSAHCWLQDGSYVLGDTVDHVRDYTPLLAV